MLNTCRIVIWSRLKLRYTQQKFNLFREDSEGYAKVIAELSYNTITENNVDVVYDKIQSLIGNWLVGPSVTISGYFDLDPNRVLGLTLDAFEIQFENSVFVKLFGMFKQEFLLDVLGFKFQYYQNPSVEELTPTSLYKAAAALIKHQYFTWEQLYPYVLVSLKVKLTFTAQARR